MSRSEMQRKEGSVGQDALLPSTQPTARLSLSARLRKSRPTDSIPKSSAPAPYKHRTASLKYVGGNSNGQLNRIIHRGGAKGHQGKPSPVSRNPLQSNPLQASSASPARGRCSPRPRPRCRRGFPGASELGRGKRLDHRPESPVLAWGPLAPFIRAWVRLAGLRGAAIRGYSSLGPSGT